MDNFGIFLFLFSVVLFFFYFWKQHIRKLKRKQLKEAAFPVEWQEILEEDVPLYQVLPVPLKEKLHGFIQIFLFEKNFEGCGGLELTDRIRVVIAAQACILLLNLSEETYYPKLYSILVYPDSYIAKNLKVVHAGLYSEGESVLAGESWESGTIVLSWSDVLSGTRDIKDGHNVVLHEFSHQLDQEDGVADGAPLLEDRSKYLTWARVLSKEYEHLQKRGGRSVIDRYGATNPAEFFAVASETFFEKPKQMKRKHPELYEELKDYYNLDPLEWL